MLSKGDLRDGLRRIAEAGSWESPKDLFAHVVADSRLKSVNFWDFLRQFRKDEAKLQELRDAAAATRGSDRRGYVPPELDCPGRHWAVAYVTWDDGFFCNLCDAVVSIGVTCLGCRLCDYDVCPLCVDRLRDTTKGTGATRTLTTLGTTNLVQPDNKHEASAESSGTRPRRRKKKVVSSSPDANPLPRESGTVHEGTFEAQAFSPDDAVEEVSTYIKSERDQLPGNSEHAQNLGAENSPTISEAPQEKVWIDPVNIPVGDDSSDDDL